MKALYYLTAITLLTLGSCSSGLYVAREYDDLYFVASDQPVVSTIVAERRIKEGTLRSEEYYDNIYAADTLVSAEYTDALNYNDANVGYYSGSGGGFYNSYDGYYSSRINRFYGNYFNPYWRDPFYYGYGYSPFSLSFGYGFGSPYMNPYSYMNPYYGYYDPFFYDSYYYGYGGMYGGYYGGYYGNYYSSYYNPWYSPYYYSRYGYTDTKYTVPILTRNTLYLMAERKEPAISQQGGQAVQPLLLLQREEIRTFPQMEQGRVPHRQYHLMQEER